MSILTDLELPSLIGEIGRDAFGAPMTLTRQVSAKVEGSLKPTMSYETVTVSATPFDQVDESEADGSSIKSGDCRVTVFADDPGLLEVAGFVPGVGMTARRNGEAWRVESVGGSDDGVEAISYELLLRRLGGAS